MSQEDNKGVIITRKVFFSSGSSSVCVLLSCQVFPNNNGVVKQKRKPKKYWVTVRPQSEKYQIKPSVMAMEKRHRYIFFSYERLVLLAWLTLSRGVLDAEGGRLFGLILSGQPGEDTVSLLRKVKQRKKGNFIKWVELRWLAERTSRCVACG